MHRDALTALTALTAREPATIIGTFREGKQADVLLSRRPCFARHPADLRPEFLDGREMFRDCLESQYLRDPRVVEGWANGSLHLPQALVFLIERYVVLNKLSVSAIHKLFVLMRIDLRPALPPADASVDVYELDLYALPPTDLKEAWRRLEGADLRRRAIEENPQLSIERLLMPAIEYSPPPSPRQASPDRYREDGSEEDDMEGSDWGSDCGSKRGSKRGAPRKRLTSLARLRTRSPTGGGGAKRIKTESTVTCRSHAEDFPDGWIREDRISPAGKVHFVIFSPERQLYPSIVKAKAAAGVA